MDQFPLKDGEVLLMVSMRMKKALHKLASERKIDMRSFKISIDKTIDGFCEELTNELKVCRNIRCDSEAKYRTIEGCCNNLKNSDLGAPFASFTRLIDPDYEDGVGLPRGGLTSSKLPSSRKVSNVVHQVAKKNTKQKFSQMVMQFGQFLDHDFTLTPEQERNCADPDLLKADQKLDEQLRVCFNIDVEETDEFYANRTQILPITRSDGICNGNVREQLNILTAFIDGSQIYGSDETFANQLRTNKNGQLFTHTLGPTLPTRKQTALLDDHFNSEDLIAGDIRAIEQPGLASLHSLFLNEHNRIAKEISEMNEGLDDEEIYQQARRLVIAEFQNIVYSEFLPVVLGSNLMELHNLNLPEEDSTVYDEKVNPTISNEFATFAFRFGHTLIPNFIRTKGEPQRSSSVICPFKDNFFNFEDFVIGNDLSGKAWEHLLLGLSSTTSQPFSPKISYQLVNYLYCVDECSLASGFGEDLAARNIQRGRDHGIPGYIKYRKFCGLTVPSSWAEKPKEIRQENWDNLKLVYNKVEEIDAFTGGVSVDSISDGVVGPTFGCILAKQFEYLLNGDRFFFTHKEDGIKKEKGLSKSERRQIQSRKLSAILCDNMDIESINREVFQSKSKLMDCKAKTKLSLNGPTQSSSVIVVTGGFPSAGTSAEALKADGTRL